LAARRGHGSGRRGSGIDALPLTTEAATLDELLTRVLAIAPELAVENGLAAIGDEIVIQLVAERAVIVAA
jgi:hypothetical protein